MDKDTPPFALDMWCCSHLGDS